LIPQRPQVAILGVFFFLGHIPRRMIMKLNKTDWTRLNGFAVEAKLIGISPLQGEPEYMDFASAIQNAYTLTRGTFIDFINTWYPGYIVKWNASLDYHHGIDCVVVSPENKWVSIDISTYPKSKLKAEVNIVDGQPIGFWKQCINKAFASK
jgi:hypothetical protein